MDPMNSIWYFLQVQRQSANRSSAEPFAKPIVRSKKFIKGALIELVLPFLVFAVVVAFCVVCFLCPTFLS
jgi:hypothetical protein